MLTLFANCSVPPRIVWENWIMARLNSAGAFQDSAFVL